MSDAYDDKDFPVHIDLGRAVPDYSSEIKPSATGSASKPKKTRTVYPSLYFDDIPAEMLSKLKKKGWALIEYKRTRISIGEGSSGMVAPGEEKDGETASGSIEVLQICLPEGEGDVAQEFANFAASKGQDTQGMGAGGDSDEDEASEPDGDDEEDES